MRESLTLFFVGLSWKLPYVRIISPRDTVILEYHGVPKNGGKHEITGSAFDSHIAFLKRNFDIVPADKIGERRHVTDRSRVVLTFDDGFRNHAEVVAPILRKHHVPATFFVCSRHSTPGKYLWFSYLGALEKHFQHDGFNFRGESIKMSADRRQASVQQLRDFLLNLKPHPTAMYEVIEQELPRLEDFVCGAELEDSYAGMTAEQVGELASDSLFTIGVHTTDHPFLTRCEPGEAFKQILDNKTWIEQVSQKRCAAIAYPAGDYDPDILAQCRRLNFAHGYVETPRVARTPHLEIPRLGIYSTSLDILGFKVQWGNQMRAWRLKVG